MVRYERTPNHGVTTLNGAINASVTSVTVNDGSVFPSEGDFRVLVGTEAMLVTARSTNTLTVERGVDGTTAASHSDGANIRSVATADQWDRLMIELGTHGGRSNDSTTTGMEPPRLLYDQPNDTILTAADFTQVNFQTTTTLTDTDYDGLRLFDTNGGANAHDLRLAVVSVPTTPWSVTAKFFMGYGASINSWDWVGLVARESSTGEFYIYRLLPWSDMLIEHMNSPTSFNTVINNDPDPSVLCPWYRINDDGTNLEFQISSDGMVWKEQASVSRTAHLAGGADQVGIAMNAEASGGNDYAMYVTSFTLLDEIKPTY